MGMAASQARLLAITAQIHDTEYKAQAIQNAKVQLATQSDNAYEEYLNALDATTLTVKDANGQKIVANFNTLCGKNAVETGERYALRTNRGQLIVTDEVKEGYDEFMEYVGENNPQAFALYMMNSNGIGSIYEKNSVASAPTSDNIFNKSEQSQIQVSEDKLQISNQIAYKEILNDIQTKTNLGNYLIYEHNGIEYLTDVKNMQTAELTAVVSSLATNGMVSSEINNVVQNIKVNDYKKLEVSTQSGQPKSNTNYDTVEKFDTTEVIPITNGIVVGSVYDGTVEGEYDITQATDPTEGNSDGAVNKTENNNKTDSTTETITNGSTEFNGHKIDTGWIINNSVMIAQTTRPITNNKVNTTVDSDNTAPIKTYVPDNDFMERIYEAEQTVAGRHQDNGKLQSLLDSMANLLDGRDYNDLSDEEKKKYDELEFAYKNQLYTSYAEEIYTEASGDDDFDYAEFAYYVSIFNQIQAAGGNCVSIADYNGENGDAASDSDWLTNMVECGKITLEIIDTDKNTGLVSFDTTSPSSDTYVDYTETTAIDKKAMAKAEAEYEHALKEIDRKDKKYDMDLSKLEAKRAALTTEYESDKKVIEDNIERTFGIFG